MHSPPAELPTDEDALAALAADTSQPEEARRQAFKRLVATIEWVARRLAVRFSAQRRADIVVDAPGDIWVVMPQFPPGGSFEAWCYTVLRNNWLEAVVRDERRRVREIGAGTCTVTDADVREAIERAIDAAGGFGSDDLAVISGWPHRDRLVLLCLAGLWQKIPGRAWVDWVREHRDTYGTPDDPFPPDGLAGCDRLADRNAVLAVALNLKRNTLSVVLYRGKFRLAELRYIKDRLGEQAEGRR